MSDEEYGTYGQTGYGEGGTSYTETTVENEGPCSCIDKAMSAMCKCFLGLLSFPLVMFLLGWNEQQAVCSSNAIIYAQSNANQVDCTTAAAAGTLAFIGCPITAPLPTMTIAALNSDTGYRMTTSDFGDSILLSGASAYQFAEQYSCIEKSSTTSSKQGSQTVSKTTYSYSMQWTTTAVSPSSFHRPDVAANACPGLNAYGADTKWPLNVNPGSSTNYQQFVNAGPYKVTNTFMQSADGGGLPPDTPVNLSPFAGKLASLNMLPTYPPKGQDWRMTSSNTAVSGQYLVSCSSPTIGCMRLSYKVNGATSVGAFASIGSDGTTQPVNVPWFWGCHAKSWMALMGYKSTPTISTLVASLHDQNTVRTWVLRAVGLVLAWMAVYCCLSPLTAAADIMGDWLRCIPCIGPSLESILEGAVECVVCIIACNTGFSCGIFVIACVWVIMRPLIGGLIMAGALLLFVAGWAIVHYSKKKSVNPKVVQGSLINHGHDDEESD